MANFTPPTGTRSFISAGLTWKECIFLITASKCVIVIKLNSLHMAMPSSRLWPQRRCGHASNSLIDVEYIVLYLQTISL